MPIFRGDDRQRLVPETLVRILRDLIADEDLDPSARRLELRSLLHRVQLMYGLDVTLNASALAQQMAEEDGIPQEDVL